jgi:GNAT superfamily N-acetyltransferase
MTGEWSNGTYTISTDKARLDVEAVHGFLAAEVYWAQGRTRELTQRAIEHSLCFGVYHGSARVGFARVITDYAVFAYLANVFVLEPHRRQSLGEWLVTCILSHEPLTTCGWTLFTKDAHPLYERFGFENRMPERLLRQGSGRSA